jgi:hypothetical protein
MGYSRQWLVRVLRDLGYSKEADEALRAFPDDIDRQQLQEFADRHHIFLDDLISRMGGSP